MMLQQLVVTSSQSGGKAAEDADKQDWKFGRNEGQMTWPWKLMCAILYMLPWVDVTEKTVYFVERFPAFVWTEYFSGELLCPPAGCRLAGLPNWRTAQALESSRRQQELQWHQQQQRLGSGAWWHRQQAIGVGTPWGALSRGAALAHRGRREVRTIPERCAASNGLGRCHGGLHWRSGGGMLKRKGLVGLGVWQSASVPSGPQPHRSGNGNSLARGAGLASGC